MSLADQLSNARGRAAEIVDEMEALGQAAQEDGRDLSSDDQAIIEALNTEADQVNNQIEALTKAVSVKEKISARRIEQSMLDDERTMSQKPAPASANSLPSKVRAQKSRFYDSNFDAYACGQWLAGILGNSYSREWCQHRGMSFRNAMEEGTDNLGGYTVPDPMAATIIRLLEAYGIFRQYARQIVMTSDTLDVPKRAAGTTVYYPGEGSPITPSDLQFASVSLVAKKYAQLSILSTELNEDSVISMVDLITQEFAWNFAFSEDTNSFLGDGSAPFASITGIEHALQDGSKHVLGAGATAATDITLPDLHALVGMLPQYSGISPRWFMHSSVYHTVCVPLLTALGGTDMRQTEQGGDLMLLGYPVTFAQVMDTASAANPGGMPIIFGDLNLGCYLGTRRAVTIRQLNELYAANDQLGIVGTMRSDSNCHSAGSATEAGAVTAIYTASV